ncbi:MAG: MG2 domain-containing protein, partial [Cytophagales bacterium]|nr:MG2 domain-containing protein [Cytophagales bacterium]
MKKFLPLSVISMLVGVVFYSFTNETEAPDSDFIKQLKNALNRYNQQLPQEKIYLHLDKPFYKPGDDIWIKAYLRDGGTHKASSTSEIVYVELINPKGSVEKTLNLIAKNGSTHGDFKLAPNAPGGIYKVR